MSIKKEVRLLFIANGSSKSSRKIEKQISKSFTQYTFLKTTHSKAAVKIASENCHLYSHIIAIGGDGTLHEVINGIVKTIGAEEAPIVSLIPAGTANDFAKSVSFPRDVNALRTSLEAGVLYKSDICEICYTTKSGSTETGYFVNIADAGIGAVVVNEVNSQPKRWGPNIAFFRAILKAFRKYKNIHIHCQTDEWEWQGPIKMLAMANGKYFGSGLMIAPGARPDDGKMTITVCGNISTYDYIKNLPSLKNGEFINHPQLFYKEAREVILTSHEDCPIEADGEMLGYTPAHIKVLPGRLHFLIASGASENRNT